jgi:hypothetical protein
MLYHLSCCGTMEGSSFRVCASGFSHTHPPCYRLVATTSSEFERATKLLASVDYNCAKWLSQVLRPSSRISSRTTLRRALYVPGFEIQLAQMGFLVPHLPARSDVADITANSGNIGDVHKSMSAFSFTLPELPLPQSNTTPIESTNK